MFKTRINHLYSVVSAERELAETTEYRGLKVLKRGIMTVFLHLVKHPSDE